MASVVGTVNKVKERLTLENAPSQPQDPVIEQFLRTAYSDLLGLLDPIRRQDLTINADLQGPTTDVRWVWHVIMGARILVPGLEWAWNTDAVSFSVGEVLEGETVTAWVTPEIDTTGAEIDTTCRFGEDWLESPAIWLTLLSCLSNMAGNAGGSAHGPHYRTLEVGYKALLEGMRARQDRWLQDMGLAIQARTAYGDLPRVQSRFTAVRNLSVRHNRATGT